jgi:hypothetical protein
MLIPGNSVHDGDGYQTAIHQAVPLGRRLPFASENPRYELGPSLSPALSGWQKHTFSKKRTPGSAAFQEFHKTMITIMYLKWQL